MLSSPLDKPKTVHSIVTMKGRIMALTFEGGVFSHSQSVVDCAYRLVKEYEAHERDQDRAVTHRNVWHKMKSKCLNTSGWFYARFGGQGVRVCEQWATDLDRFTDDMGPVPVHAVGIERIQKDKHFTPENTVWKF